MILQFAAMLLSQATVVFNSPNDGFHTFRIPSLIKSSKRTLVALCEGRQGLNDAAQNQIILRRSTDDGRTWQPLFRVAKMDGSLNNPCVVEAGKGKLVLHFQHYPSGTHEYDAVPGHSGPKSVQAFQVESSDDGVTWSVPKNISTQVKALDVATIASGPGVGIRLERGRKKGRLLMPYNQRIGQRWSVYMALSDDQGKTWRRGATVDQPSGINANEIQVVELAEGGVMLNARNQATGGTRCVALSHDAGENFSRIELDTRLIDPSRLHR
jgi:sialidase-1